MGKVYIGEKYEAISAEETQLFLLKLEIFLPLHPQTLLVGCVFLFLNPSDRECLHP